MTYTNTDIKKIAKAALKSEYGFKPRLKNIILQEVSFDRTYIRFAVGIHEYIFNSYRLPDGSVRVGSGTLEKRS